MKLTKHQKFLSLCFMLMLAVVMATGIVFASINQSVVRKYPSVITATSVVFRYNGNTYYDAIGSDDLDLFKGEPRDITMSISVSGAGRHVVDYSIGFDAFDLPDVAQAIEVYHFDGNRYVFLCMMSDINSHDINGQMYSLSDKKIHLRFVYSAASSDFGIEQAFSIKATADASILPMSEKYVFALDDDEFASVFESPDSRGKTIVLLNDITVSSQLTSNGIVGIDLNGKNLVLEQNIIVNCAHQMQTELGIINSGLGGGITSATGKFITVSNLTSCYLVANSINTDLISGVVRIDPTQPDFVYVFSHFEMLLDQRVNRLTDGSLYYYDGDVSFLFDDIKYYADLFGLYTPQDSVIQKEGDAYKIRVSNLDTSRFLFAFLFEFDNQPASTTGYVTVRGSSPKSIADALMDKIPALVSSSQLLKRYDNLTGSYIDWYINDGLGGLLLDSNGKYKKSGMQAVADAVDSFEDRQLDIYIKVTKGAETGSKAGNEADTAAEPYLYYKRQVQTASAAELTVLLFDSRPAAIFKDNDYDIAADYLLDKYKDKIDLTAVSIEIVPNSDELGYFGVYKREIGSNFDIVRAKNGVTIPQNSLNKAKLNITFFYGSGQSEKIHSLQKDIVIAGDLAEITKYDVQYRLQGSFVGNDYTEGRKFVFYAYGALLPKTMGVSVPVFVDYKPMGDAAKYISVTYEYIEVDKEDHENQIAYFVFDGEKYVFADDTTLPGVKYYEKKANIEVLPSKIMSNEQMVASILATLYTVDEDGEPHLDKVTGAMLYIDPVTGFGQELSYTLTLAIEGVIHNNDKQIADANLYYVYRQIFDGNNDGIITAKEANDWDAAVVRGAAAGLMKKANLLPVGAAREDVYYIDLSGINITTLKGIEYFPKTQGFDLSDTGRVDISALSLLNNLVYLDLSYTETGLKAITNLAPLALMDRLEYLDLTNNKVSNLEPLRYLPRLVTLKLDNNRIIDFEPLTEMTTLLYLSFSGMTTNFGASFKNDPKTMYDFALVKINCPEVDFFYGEAIEITKMMQVGVKVMRDLEEINRVRHTLYLPTYYYYPDENGDVIKYKLHWYTDPFETNLTFSYDAEGNAHYDIKSPIYNKKVMLYLKVYNGEYSDDFCRDFTLTLETHVTAGLYIYDTLNDKYVDAEAAIPDDRLRSVIFEYFNEYSGDDIINITLDGGGQINTTEEFVISKRDFDHFVDNRLMVYNWSYQGIASLKGIGYLSSIFDQNISLILTGNKFDDLSPLKDLESLHTLTLGGAYYDFSQLVGLSSLYNLYVYESYDLDSEDALKSLYALYISDSELYIFLSDTMDETKAWNPYEVILPKKVSRLPTTATFVKLGDTFDLYQKKKSFVIEMYDVTYYFTVESASVYNVFANQSESEARYFSVTTGDEVGTGGLITYKAMYSNQESAYLKAKITSTETDGHSKISFDSYFVQLIADDASDMIIVHNTTGDNSGFTRMPLGQLVGSRDLKSAAMTLIFTYINANADKKVDSIGELSGSNFYYDEKADKYHVTTDMLTSDGAITASSGSISGGTTLYNYGTYDFGENSLKGLRYFTSIVTLFLYRDANLGDGSELVNITTLSIEQSAVDFTTITTELPNLKSITVKNFYLFKAGNESDSAFVNFPNLKTLTVSDGLSTSTSATAVNMQYIDDLSFLLGLIKNDGGIMKTELATLAIFGVSGSTITTSTNAGFVKILFLAAGANNIDQSYQIGSPENKSDAGFFRVIENIPWYCTANDDESRSTTWDVVVDTTRKKQNELEYYNNLVAIMRDFGLKVNDNYWLTNKVFSVGADAKFTLPGTTGLDNYGLKFGVGAAMEKSYGIKWKIYFIKPDGTNEKYGGLDYDEINTRADTTIMASSYNNGNGFLVFVATSTDIPEGATPYSCFYHFVIGSGDGYYSAVKDEMLRAWMFTKEYGTSPVTTEINIGNTASIALAATNLGITRLTGDNASRAIYTLEGFDDAVRQWDKHRGLEGDNSLFKTVKKITIYRAAFTNIEPIFLFEDLTDLHLYSDNIARYSYVKLDKIQGKLLNLKVLNLNYNVSITPDDIAKLVVDAAVRPLTDIRLFRTSCMYNLETIKHLNAISNARNVTLKIALNEKTGTTDITRAQLNAFVADTNPDTHFPSINNTMAIYSAGTETRTIGGTSYTFVMSEYVNRMIRFYNVHNEVPVKLRVANCGIPQFYNTYIETVYKTSGILTPLRFGSGGLTIGSFDTELIAYLLTPTATTSKLVQIGGNYFINPDADDNKDGVVLISPQDADYGFGISSFRNVGTLTNGGVSVSYDPARTYCLALAYKEIAKPLYTAPSPAALTGSFAGPSANMLHRNISATYAYTVKNDTVIKQPKYTAEFPSHVYVGGVPHVITWSIDTIKNLTIGGGSSTLLTTVNQKILTNQGGTPITTQGVWYELSKDTVGVTMGNTTGSFRLRYVIANQMPGTTGSLASGNLTVTITKHEDDTVQQEHNFFVEVSEVAGQAVLLNDSGTVYYTVQGATPFTMYKLGGKYYTENVAGSLPVSAVLAGDIFESQRLIQYLYAKHYIGDPNKVLDQEGGSVRGYIMTADNIKGMEKLEIFRANITDASAYLTQYVTSLEGVQIFYKMTSFYAGGGSFTSIEPLSTLALKEFYYGNSAVETVSVGRYGSDYLISDFTPLLKGSRETLEKFTYNSMGTVQMTDMNFLLAFAKLTEVNLGAVFSSDNVIVADYTNGLAYFTSPSGKYLISQLASRKPKPVYIYVHPTLADIFELEYDLTKGKLIDWSTDYMVYPLTVPVEYKLSWEILNKFHPKDPVFNNPFENPDAVLSDDYLMTIGSSGYDLEKDEYLLNFKLTSLIYSGGGFYFVDWISASANLTVNGYTLSRDITIDGKTYTTSMLLTKEDAQKIAQSIEYFTLYKSGQNCLSVSVSTKVENPKDLSTTVSRLICRIDYGDSLYERMITVAYTS